MEGFVLLYKLPYVTTIFATSRKKGLDPNGPYISTFQTILRNGCLSVISKFCLSLSVVVCCASTVYTGLCRRLKYLLKVRYIIPNHLNVVRFFDFRHSLFGQSKNIDLCHKNTSKYLTEFEFGST